MTQSSTRLDAKQAAQMLQNAQDVLILCHKRPDGDTFGSGFALLRTLWSLGKRAAIACSDGFSQHFSFLFPDFSPQDSLNFSPAFVVAVDVADLKLLDEPALSYGQRCDLAIDHHPSNSQYARYLFLEEDAAAACEMVYAVLMELDVSLTPEIATALYTGLCTDTGCFRYANTTARTLRIAAHLHESGADAYGVTKRLLETKSPNRLKIEQLALQSLEYHYSGKVALLTISHQDILTSGVAENETEGLASIPRQIQGVEVGITFKESIPGIYHISLRTGELADASIICRQFGGGGHRRAGGCEVKGHLPEIKAAFLEQVAPLFAG